MVVSVLARGHATTQNRGVREARRDGPCGHARNTSVRRLPDLPRVGSTRPVRTEPESSRSDPGRPQARRSRGDSPVESDPTLGEWPSVACPGPPSSLRSCGPPRSCATPPPGGCAAQPPSPTYGRSPGGVPRARCSTTATAPPTASSRSAGPGRRSSEIEFRPSVLRDVSTVDTGRDILGRPFGPPVRVRPHRLHPDDAHRGRARGGLRGAGDRAWCRPARTASCCPTTVVDSSTAHPCRSSWWSRPSRRWTVGPRCSWTRVSPMAATSSRPSRWGPRPRSSGGLTCTA